MWARVAETMLALWLVISPFIFRSSQSTADWVIAFAVGPLVGALALLSFWYRAHRAHAGVFAIGVALAGWAYFTGGHPSPPPAQNQLIVGLLLAMLAIIPSHNQQPPAAWRAFYERGEDRDATIGPVKRTS